MKPPPILCSITH